MTIAVPTNSKQKNMEYKDKIYNSAREKGYMVGCTKPEWKMSFCGAFIRKYPNRTGVLDIMKEVLDGKKPEWELITDQALRDFYDVVTERMSQNSARTTFQRVKATISEYLGEVNMPSKKWKEILVIGKESTMSIYLTEQDIELIEQYEPESYYEGYVKCATLISCYTGCRHSDAMKVTMENIQGDTFSYVPEKTNAITVSIPVHRNLRKYIGKYDYKDIPLPTYNNTLKRICKNCGIVEKVKVHKGGQDLVGQKWEFVGSHTSRRSFATNLYLHHCDIFTISKLMGHSNVAQTEKYICCKRNVPKEAMKFFA